MRYIILVLLVANIYYFVWNYFRVPPVLVVAEPRPLLNTGLTLLEEYDAQFPPEPGEAETGIAVNSPNSQSVPGQQQAATGITADSRNSPPVPGQQEASDICSVVTGFADADAAEDFMGQAAILNIGSSLQFVDSEEPLRYRVYLPPTPSRDIATGIMEDLAASLTEAELDIEFFLITGGELDNAVSLGVFSSATRATSVQDQVTALGYDAMVAQIGEPRPEIAVWLRATDTESVSQPQWLELTGTSTHLTVEEKSCEGIAQSIQFQ